jgi:hypothetical protein
MKTLMELWDANPIGLWGAALSTILAVIKGFEIWKARSRITISYNFTSNEGTGNEVIIRNIGPAPIIITYWELIWLQHRFLRGKPSHSIGPEENVGDIKLAAHSSTKLIFQGQNGSDWGASALRGRKIFIRLHLAGKSWPVMRKVYG